MLASFLDSMNRFLICIILSSGCIAQVIIHEGGTVKLENGGGIKTKETNKCVEVMGSQTTPDAAGELKLIGLTGNTVTITANGADILIHGKFSGTNFAIDKPPAQGLKFLRTAANPPQILQFATGRFDNVPNDGSYITFAKGTWPGDDLSAALSQTLFSGCIFNNQLGSTGAFNVRLDANYVVNGSTTNILHFLNATGVLAGEAYDWDPTDSTINRIRWELDNVPPIAKVFTSFAAPNKQKVQVIVSEPIPGATQTLTIAYPSGQNFSITLTNPSGDMVTWEGELTVNFNTGAGTAIYTWQATDFAGNVGNEICIGKTFTPPAAVVTISPEPPIVFAATFNVTLITSKPVQWVPALSFTPEGGSPASITLSSPSAPSSVWTGPMTINQFTGNGTAQFKWSGVDTDGIFGNAILAGELFQIDVIGAGTQDHGGNNVIIGTNGAMGGFHTGINVFFVPENVSLTVLSQLKITASKIIISGVISDPGGFGVILNPTGAPVLVSPPLDVDPEPDVPAQAQFIWEELAPGLTYKIEIATSPSFGPGTIVAEQITTATSSTHTFATSGPYFWRVTNLADPTNLSVTWRTDVDAIAPPPVATLTAVGREGKVSLSWTAVTAPDLAGYNVYRSVGTQGPPTVKVNSTVITTTSFTHILPFGGTFDYAVRAVDRVGNESPNSNVANATATPDTTAPSPPVFTTTNNKKTNDNTPKLEGIAEPGTTVKIFFYPAVIDYDTVIAGSDGKWFSHKLSPTLADGTYQFVATSTDLANNVSNASDPITITIDTTGPPAPTNLMVTQLNGALFITWDAPAATDILGYKIFRKGPADADFVLINPIDASTGKAILVSETKFKDVLLSNGSNYCYKVAAVDDSEDEKHN